MYLKNLFKLFKSGESDDHQEVDRQVDTSGQIIKLSDEMELQIRGLPQNLSHEHRTKVLASLVRNALVTAPERIYQKGENIHSGTARLRVLNKIYDVEFSINATRVLTALAIYKKAFDAINAGAAAGIYDRELAEMTADFIRQSAWQEVQDFRSQKVSNSEEPSSIYEDKSMNREPAELLKEGAEDE